MCRILEKVINSCTASQNFPSFTKLEVNKVCHGSWTALSCLDQVSPVHIVSSYLFKCFKHYPTTTRLGDLGGFYHFNGLKFLFMQHISLFTCITCCRSFFQAFPVSLSMRSWTSLGCEPASHIVMCTVKPTGTLIPPAPSPNYKSDLQKAEMLITLLRNSALRSSVRMIACLLTSKN
jgi:hypothetical protein